MLRSRTAVRACSLVLALGACPSTGEAALAGAGRLAAVYDLILSAQFDRADADLTSTCPPAPAEACTALAAVSVWWRIQIDPDNRTRDTLFNDRARAAVKAA